MHPALYLELLQTRRSGRLYFLLAFGAPFLLRLVFGEVGLVMVLLAVLPQLGGSLGISSFSEEIAKGQLRFLFALPVRRSGIWLVKLLSGLTSAAVMVAATVAGLSLASLVRPVEISTLSVVLAALSISWKAVLLLMAAYGLFSYACGLFSILACRNPKHAQLLSLPLVYGPVLVLWLLRTLTGTLPALRWTAAALLASEVVLVAGSRILFKRRNPFVGRGGLAGRAVGFAALALLVFGAGAFVAVNFLPEDVTPDPRRVMGYEVAPDGDAVFLFASSGFSSHGFLLNAEGRVVADLGPGASPLFPPTAMWSPQGRWLVFERGPQMSLLSVKEELEEPRLVAFDRVAGSFLELEQLASLGEGEHMMLSGWNREGTVLWGTLRSWDDSKGLGVLGLIRHDLQTGSIEEEQLVKDIDSINSMVGGRLVLDSSAGSGESDGRELVFLDPADGTETLLRLAAEPEQRVVTPDGKTVTTVTRTVKDGRVSFHAAFVDVESGTEEVVLSPPDLPDGTVEQAARDGIGYVALDQVARGGWILCRASDADGTERIWLLAPARRLVVAVELGALDVPDGGLQGFFASPTGTRLLVTDWTGEGAPLVTRVLSIDADGLEPVAEFEIQNAQQVTWLDDERLLYTVLLDQEETLLPGAELWVLDVETAERRLFFTGQQLESQP